MSHDFSIGELVFIFSETLEEVIYGKIVGFSEIKRTRVRVSQSTDDGNIIHIVSWIYVFRDRESALRVSEEYLSLKSNQESLKYTTGMSVYLKQSDELVRDEEDNPYVYQIIKLNHKKSKVTLIDTQGDIVGEFPQDDIVFASYDPIFDSKDYRVGQLVSWIEGDEIYEGIITSLSKHKALVTNIKKLLPLDKKKSLPYYKIESDDSYNKILTYVIGDTIDSE